MSIHATYQTWLLHSKWEAPVNVFYIYMYPVIRAVRSAAKWCYQTGHSLSFRQAIFFNATGVVADKEGTIKHL